MHGGKNFNLKRLTMIQKNTPKQNLSVWIQADLLKGLRERHGANLSEVVRTLLLDHMTKPDAQEEPPVIRRRSTKFQMLCDMIQEHPNYSVARLMRETKSSRGYVNAAIRQTTGIRRRNPKPQPVQTTVANVPVVSVYQRFKKLFTGV
jgi:hypothetical protein